MEPRCFIILSLLEPSLRAKSAATEGKKPPLRNQHFRHDSAHVKVRETDRVGLKRGHLRFLGRSIFRRPGSSALYMQVDPTYLDEAFAEFDLKKESTFFSRFASHFGQQKSQPSSAEGHAHFRRVLGRFMVLSDSSGLVDFGQHAWNWTGTTVETHEKCLRAVLNLMMAVSIRRACFARCERFGSLHRCWVCSHEKYWTSLCFRYLLHLSAVSSY